MYKLRELMHTLKSGNLKIWDVMNENYALLKSIIQVNEEHPGWKKIKRVVQIEPFRTLQNSHESN